MSTSQNKPTSKYVPALRDESPPVYSLAPLDLPEAPISLPMPHSSHYDRARAFTLATAPLAGIVGFVALLVGITAFSVPFLSVVALLLVLGGFALTWGIAFVVHTFVSADGSLFIYTLLTFQYLRREQKERHKRYKGVRRE